VQKGACFFLKIVKGCLFRQRLQSRWCYWFSGFLLVGTDLIPQSNITRKNGGIKMIKQCNWLTSNEFSIKTREGG
jgi:hypothetical protein